MKIALFAKGNVGVNAYKHLKQFYGDGLILMTRRNEEPDNYQEQESNIFRVDSNEEIGRIFDNYKPEWLINAWADLIFSGDTLNKVKNTINLHPSLLPLGKGSDSVAYCMSNNLPVGFTFHEITPRLDDGPIYYQEQVHYTFGETARMVQDRVIELLNNKFNQIIMDIINGKVVRTTMANKENFQVNTRKNTERMKRKNIDEFKDCQNLARWALSHTFGESSSPIITIGEYTYSLKMEAFEEDDSKD